MNPKTAIFSMALISALLIIASGTLLLNDQAAAGWVLLVVGALSALITMGQLGKAIR